MKASVYFCFKAFVVLAVLLFAGAALAQEPDHVSFTFEGCRNNGDILLPNGSGQFICPDKQPSQPNKDAYTGGELGKGSASSIDCSLSLAATASRTRAERPAIGPFDAIC